jgi:hypothetical protein
MPRRVISQEEIDFYTHKVTNLGHTFIALHTSKRCEFKCGNCGVVSIGNRKLLAQDENIMKCMYCHELSSSSLSENIKTKDPCKGVRSHQTITPTGKKRVDTIYIFECLSCNKRYENVSIDRGCLNCSFSKRDRTNISRYGASNVFASTEIKEKIVKSNKERFGVDYPLQNKDIKTKQQTTNLKKYGHKYAFNQPHVYEKVQATHTENHGAPFPLQSPSIGEKMKENSLAKFMLLKTYNEDQLIADSKAIPHINYTDKSQKNT